MEIGDERLPERFWKKVHVNSETECWEWTGHTFKGYARFWVSKEAGGPKQGHVVAWEEANGPKPSDGRVLDHLCEVRKCVNPAHLELVTQKENLWRSEKYQSLMANGSNAPKRVRVEGGTCAHGHLIEPGSYRHYKTATGYDQFQCLVCKRAKQRAYDQEKHRAI